MKSAYAKASANAVSTKSILPSDRMPFFALSDENQLIFLSLVFLQPHGIFQYHSLSDSLINYVF